MPSPFSARQPIGRPVARPVKSTGRAQKWRCSSCFTGVVANMMGKAGSGRAVNLLILHVLGRTAAIFWKIDGPSQAAARQTKKFSARPASGHHMG